MSPLKVSRAASFFANLGLSPSRQGIGRSTQVVNIKPTDHLKFENDLALGTTNYAGYVEISDEKDQKIKNVQLDRGDKAVINVEGSLMSYVVKGVDWGRRK